ncbi:MAG: YeeE/YedE family protein [Thiotrichales bacterium]
MALENEMLVWGFVIALVMGAVTKRTRFCTMGAVADLVNTGDAGRMRAWILAGTVAMLGVAGMHLFGLIDLGLVANNDTSSPPYRTSQFAWPRYLVGGVMFGVGMTLASGCGYRTLVRLGGGNLKALAVLAAMAFAAYLMIFTNFGYNAFLRWMQPGVIDLEQWGLPDQGLDTVLAGVLETPRNVTHAGIAIILGGGLLSWVLRAADFRRGSEHAVGGLVVGLTVVAAWYVTAGPIGQALLEEIAFMDTQPLAAGAQSLTFIQPSAHLWHWVASGFSSHLVTFALIVSAGVLVGSFAYSAGSGRFRIEWFSDWRDSANHVLGGLLMGIGGVLAMGCTIGQGVAGISTLALGSFVTFGAIVLGSALTIKFMYYRMVYARHATFWRALTAALSDLRLWPTRLRGLDPL